MPVDGVEARRANREQNREEEIAEGRPERRTPVPVSVSVFYQSGSGGGLLLISVLALGKFHFCSRFHKL